MSRLLAAALALFAFAGPAAAHRFEARLAPASPPAELVSAGMGWTCSGASCAAEGPMSDAPVRICSHVARQLGRVEAFAVDAAPLDVPSLVRCNAHAAGLGK